MTEFAKIDSKATKIHKNQKTQTKINKYRQKSDPKYPKIDNNPSNLTANGQKSTKGHENQQTSSKKRPKTNHFHECFQKLQKIFFLLFLASFS